MGNEPSVFSYPRGVMDKTIDYLFVTQDIRVPEFRVQRTSEVLSKKGEELGWFLIICPWFYTLCCRASSDAIQDTVQV